MRKLFVFVSTVAMLAMGGCEFYGTAKNIAYDKAADLGNRYCGTRDTELRDDLVGRVNAGLRNAGAKFSFDGITCDPPPLSSQRKEPTLKSHEERIADIERAICTMTGCENMADAMAKIEYQTAAMAEPEPEPEPEPEHEPGKTKKT